MKMTLLALTAFTFVATQIVDAQDPSVAIPTEQSEAAAAEAAATPAREGRLSLPAEKTAAPTPKASSSSAASKKSETTTPDKKMSAEATVRDLENKWVASVAAHDATIAQKVLADDYAGVSSRGQVMDKKGLLAQIKKDTDTYASAKITKMTVRVFGNAAVVIGTSNESGKDSGGGAFNRTYRWTDTWALRNGAWQCVASQSAQVAR